jgi:O-antigen ligase
VSTGALAGASLRSYGSQSLTARASLEAVFGLLLVAVLLLSTVDRAFAAPVRSLFLGCFALLTIVNAGAGAAVYVASVLVFSVRHAGSDLSFIERPDNFAFLFLAGYLAAARCFSRSAGRFGRTATAVMLLLLTSLIHLVALVGIVWFWLAWFARMFGIPFVLFVLLRRAALSPREVRAMLLILAVLGLYLALVTILEVLGLYSLVLPPWLADPNFNPLYGDPRVGGVAMQAEWNALEISLGLGALLLMLLQGRRGTKFGWAIGAALCVVAIYFCYTRAAFLGLLIGGIPWFWQRAEAAGTTVRRRLLIILGVVGFASFVLFFPSQILQGRVSNTGNVHFRLNIWAAALGMVADHPLFGVGFGHFSGQMMPYLRNLEFIPAYGQYAEGSLAHNTSISVAAELGLVGLALYAFVVWGTFKTAYESAGTAWGAVGPTWLATFALVYFVNIQFVTAHVLAPNAMSFAVLGAIAGMRNGNGRPREAPMRTRW